jgi:hypothetical protein
MALTIKVQVGDILVRRTIPSNLEEVVYLQILDLQETR